MRTTIAIDEEMMGELMRAERGVSRSEAVRRAVREYLRHKRVDEFMKLAGSRLVDLDWRAAERQSLDEADRMQDLARPSRSKGRRGRKR